MRKLFTALLAAVGLGLLLFAAVIVVELNNADATANKHQAAAQRDSDDFAQRYAAGVGRLLKQDTGGRPLTDADLAPDVVVGGPQFGGAAPKLTYRGSPALIARTDGPTALSLTIQIEMPYPASMGAQGVLWTCYQVTVPTTAQATAPTATRLAACPSVKP